MAESCTRSTIRGFGIRVPCANLLPCPTHDLAQHRLSSEEHLLAESERAFERSLSSHEANAHRAWALRTGKELVALPLPPMMEQEVLFG